MGLLKSEAKIGTGHVSPKVRIPEDFHLLKLESPNLSLFMKMLRTARDERYGEFFGRIEGTDKEWANLTKKTISEVFLSVQILKHAGLIEEKEDGFYIKNSNLWYYGTLAEKKAFIDEIAKQVGYWGE